MLSKPSSDLKKSLHEELKEGDTHLTKKMKEEKEEFIKKFHKHQIKSSDADFEKALDKKQDFNVISVKKQQVEDVEELEEKVKKGGKSKRQKHN